MSVTLLRSGYQTTVQDQGRPHHRASGVSVGGALDQHALRIANLLVGNEPSAAGLEVSIGELWIRFDDDRLVAWCGSGSLVAAGEVEISAGRAVAIRAGDELRTTLAKGARGWLAISGGIDVPIVLGSRSTDLRGRFGGCDGRALHDGDVLPLAAQSTLSQRTFARLAASRVGGWGAPHEWSSPATSHGILRIVRGADWHRFEKDSISSFLIEKFSVTDDANRMGIRLEGKSLSRADIGDLASEAVVPGTIQVPPNGQPILLLGDCQTIGGYPKIAHVITVDLSATAQLRPGDAIRFAEVSLAEAQQLLLERETETARFRMGLLLLIG